MNAIQFIKDYGVDKARKVIDGAPKWAMSINFNNGMYYSRMEHKKGDTFLYDLKRLVESVDLIGKYYSIDHAKNHYNNMREALNQYQYENKDIEALSNELEKAIADYELIYSNDMRDDSHIENHISPLCKVGGEVMRSELFEEAWKQNRHVWESTKCLAQAMYLAGEQHQQSKIDELQKRVDAALKLIPSLKSENDLWGCEQVERQIELLEQALKGGDE